MTAVLSYECFGGASVPDAPALSLATTRGTHSTPLVGLSSVVRWKGGADRISLVQGAP